MGYRIDQAKQDNKTNHKTASGSTVTGLWEAFTAGSRH